MSVGPLKKRKRRDAQADHAFLSFPSFRFLPFRVSPATCVSDGAAPIRTCVDLKATPGDRASFLFLAL